MRRRSLLAVAAFVCVAMWAGWYLYDPPWVARVTSGLRDWEVDPDGTRFRWTNGHASFFVPAIASELTLPIRAVFPASGGAPVVARISVDDRWLTDVELRDPTAWVSPTVPLSAATHRRWRRIDVRVSRVVGFLNLGVQLGEPRLR